MCEQDKRVNKEIQNIKKNKLWNLRIIELKSSLLGFNRSFDLVEQRISKLNDRSFEVTQTEEQKEKKRNEKNEEDLRD